MANTFLFSELMDMREPKRVMPETNKEQKTKWLRGKILAAKTFVLSHKLDKPDSFALIGAALIVRGIALWSVPAAFIFAGLAFLFIAYHSAPASSTPTKEQ